MNFGLFLQGLGKEFIFSHHQKAYEGNKISWYDQQFNKREITESKLPPLRSWDRQKLAWAPEKSDYPIKGLFKMHFSPINSKLQQPCWESDFLPPLLSGTHSPVLRSYSQ